MEYLTVAVLPTDLRITTSLRLMFQFSNVREMQQSKKRDAERFQGNVGNNSIVVFSPEAF